MSGKITLSIMKGSMSGREFVFEEHDTFLFGRAEDCHACLPDDSFVSSHHFILEVNPPRVRPRDLGSLNGTFVNGKRFGGRVPLPDAPVPDPDAPMHKDLFDGDRIQVGETLFQVAIRHESAETLPLFCPACGGKLEQVSKNAVTQSICPACKEKESAEQAAQSPRFSDAPTVLEEKRPVIVGEYTLEGELGRGGMGVVHLGKRGSDGARTAIKVIQVPHMRDDQALRAFQREMGTMARLSHPHIVEFLESFADRNRLCLIMEYCARGSVQDLLLKKGGRLPVDLATAIIKHALKGLAHAHQQNVVHRDIKPANLLLAGTRTDWKAKIADFGLAKSLDKAGLSGMTATGTYGGTLDFMPYEQLTHYKYVRPASDVWSIAATFYYMATGQLPRIPAKNGDPIETVLQNQIVPLQKRMPEAPSAITRIINQALSADLAKRHENAQALLEALNKTG